jgi:hypothetical protein
MGAPLSYKVNNDLWVSNTAVNYFREILAENAKNLENDIPIAFQEAPKIAGRFSVSGLGLNLENFFKYFENTQKDLGPIITFVSDFIF